MKLSIIVPIYNTEKYLIGCVTSIFEQQIPQNDFEIILVNDGSTDGSLKICHFLAGKYGNIKIINQENRGQSSARNVGLKSAKGRFIYFMDSDDYLESGYLNKFLNILEEKSLDFIGFKIYSTSQACKNIDKVTPLSLGFQGKGIDIIEQVPYHNGACWYIFDKNLAENLLFEEGRVCEDILFTTQLLLKVKKGRIYNNHVYAYFLNINSTINTKDTERSRKLNNDMFYVVERFSDIIGLVDFKINKKVFLRLKTRQESYAYFAIIRFIKSGRKFSELSKYLLSLQKNKHSAYPINYFKGYSWVDNFLIRCFNNRAALRFIIWLNRLIGLVK